MVQSDEIYHFGEIVVGGYEQGNCDPYPHHVYPQRGNVLHVIMNNDLILSLMLH